MAIDIRKELKRFVPNLIKAREDNLAEADTAAWVCKFFEEVLGYDFQDISHEVSMKYGKHSDVCLKIDGKVRLLVEFKAAANKLRDKDILQLDRYASENNHHWALLTNGVDWHLHHLTFDDGIDYEKAFDVSIDNEETLNNAVELLALLHKKSIAKDELENWWGIASALSPQSLAKALFDEDVLNRLRQVIHRETSHLIDIEDLANKIYKEMFDPQIRERIGEIHIKKHRKTKNMKPNANGPSPPAQ
jgi:hypothetical protein